MMKKNGFTLAEVLITLAIIGVVATLTLPALMTNTQEQQAITGLKKGLNTLTEAAQMNNAIAGFDYASFTSTETNDEAQSMYALLSNRTTMDKRISGTASGEAKKVAGTTGNYVAFFRDGSAVVFTNASTTSPGTVQTDDNIVYGIPAIYDTNGVKGPNLLSNCAGTVNLKMAAGSTDAGDIDDCKDKSKRIIKDQFSIRLRGAFVVPSGRASKWAMEN